MTALETDLLAELIRRKQECLVQLREMGRHQLALIQQESMAALMDLLGTKQRMLIRLEQVERALDPFRGQDPETRTWRSSESRRACREAIQACEALLAEILALERQSEQELTRRRDETARRLRCAQGASEARGAYAALATPAVTQLDLTSET